MRVHYKKTRRKSPLDEDDLSWCCLIVQLDSVDRCDIFCFGSVLVGKSDALRAGTVVKAEVVVDRTRWRVWTGADKIERTTPQYVAKSLRVIKMTAVA